MTNKNAKTKNNRMLINADKKGFFRRVYIGK